MTSTSPRGSRIARKLKFRKVNIATRDRGKMHRLLCCLWKARLPQRRQSVWVFVCLLLHGEINKRVNKNKFASWLTRRTRYLSSARTENYQSQERNANAIYPTNLSSGNEKKLVRSCNGEHYDPKEIVIQSFPTPSILSSTQTTPVRPHN